MGTTIRDSWTKPSGGGIRGGRWGGWTGGKGEGEMETMVKKKKEGTKRSKTVEEYF